jgi:hypothetical protein
MNLNLIDDSYEAYLNPVVPFFETNSFLLPATIPALSLPPN